MVVLLVTQVQTQLPQPAPQRVAMHWPVMPLHVLPVMLPVQRQQPFQAQAMQMAIST
jgi:hypothetical protein